MQLDDLFKLIEKFDQSSLSEVRVSNNEDSVVLKKGGDAPAPYFAGYPPAYASAQAPAPTAAAPAEGVASAPAAETGTPGIEAVTAPIVGTFYRAPAPDSPAFVEVGKKIKTGETLCLIEAMKVLNELQAEFDLEVVSIVAENGQMVDYGATLFEVRRL
jgi:acetyl-CoA carboxylase biotin carboxyl carrier protein